MRGLKSPCKPRPLNREEPYFGKESVELRMRSDTTVLVVGEWEPVSRGASDENEGVPWWIWLIGKVVTLLFLAE
jgi:hypothetical protein